MVPRPFLAHTMQTFTSQAIVVTVGVAGPQEIRFGAHADYHGHTDDRQVSVTDEGVMIFVYDTRIVLQLTALWVAAASHPMVTDLPVVARVGGRRFAGIDEPTVLLTAYQAIPDADIKVSYHPDRRALQVRYGRICWMVHDRTALRDLLLAWTQALNVAPKILNHRPELDDEIDATLGQANHLAATLTGEPGRPVA